MSPTVLHYQQLPHIAVFRNVTPFSLVDGYLSNELHSLAFGTYCDMLPESRNSEIRGDVHC
jgi:hypothetical protein